MTSSTKDHDLILPANLDPTLALRLAALDGATAEWRSEIGEVDEETIVYQPYPNGHSIGALILHMADVEAFWIERVGAGRPLSEELQTLLLSNETLQYEFIWPTAPRKPLAWYYDIQNAIRHQTQETVRELADPLHTGALEDETFTLRWLLDHVIAHEAYHGGQAVLLSILANRSS